MKLFHKLLVIVSTTAPAFLVASAADVPKPVFIRGTCLDPISSKVLSSFKEEIRKSRKYGLVRDMSDEGRMDMVLTINISCGEHQNVAAIATVFGRAKCFGVENCHHAVDGSSLRAESCEASNALECGQALFRAFDDYVINPLKPSLELN
jgi:hypothetical protein